MLPGGSVFQTVHSTLVAKTTSALQGHRRVAVEGPPGKRPLGLWGRETQILGRGLLARECLLQTGTSADRYFSSLPRPYVSQACIL